MENDMIENGRQELEERGAMRQMAAARLLMQTDERRLDDARRGALFRVAASGIAGMDVTDPKEMFGRRASKDMGANIDLLRRLVKGEYDLLDDPAVAEWRKVKEQGEEAAAKYADAKIGGNKDAGHMKWGFIAAAGAAVAARNGAAWQNIQPSVEDMNREVAKTNYDSLDEEGKAKWRKERIEDYERRLAVGNPVASFLKMTGGLDDRAKWIVQKAYRTGELGREELKDYSDKERDQILAAVSLMRGDRKTGTLAFIPGVKLDDSESWWGRRKQDLYALQQSFLDIPKDIGATAKDIKDYVAASRLSGADREEAFRRMDEDAAIKAALDQPLAEPSSFLGAMSRGVAENVWFLLPVATEKLGINMMRASQGVKAAEGAKGFFTDLKVTLTPWRAGRPAKEAVKQANAAANELRAAKLAKGVKMVESASKDAALVLDGKAAAGSSREALAIRRQMAAMKRYTDDIRKMEAMSAEAAKRVPKEIAQWWGGAAVREAGGTAMFSSFFREYVDAADAGGISREESVPTGICVGFVNGLVERMWTPGLEGNVAASDVKFCMIDSLAHAIQKTGGATEWLKKAAWKVAANVPRTVATESGVEEPLQQLVTEFGLALNRRQEQLREEGRGDLASALADLWQRASADRILEKTLETYVDAAWESLPGSIGLGLMEIPLSAGGQRLRRWVTGVDEGIADVMQRGIDAWHAVDAHWGEAEANPNRTVEALTAARKAWRDSQGSGVEAIAKATGLDVKTAEVLSQYFSVEADMELVSPRFSAWKDLNLSLADIDENTIRTLLPGYVEGSFASDPERGIYAAKTKLGDGVERTIAYRRGDISDILSAQVAENEKIDSEFGASWDASIDEHNAAGVVDGVIQADMRRRWREMSEAERHEAAVQAALATKGIEHREGGVFELSDSKGNKVVVNANDVISLSNGRVGDIGYGAAATQATVRHETFHALWRFVRGTLGDAEVQQLAKSVGVDVTKKGWEVDLDEKMANQLERYASGHYVAHAISSKLDRFLDSGAGKLVDFFGKIGQGDEVTNPNTGKSYQLKDFYDEVLRGRLGSGALGVALKATKTQGQAPASGQDGDGVRGEAPSVSKSAMPVEVTDEERAAHEEETRGASAAEEAPVPPETPNSSTPNSPTPSSAEEPADASTPNQRFYRVGLPNSDVKLVGRLEVRDAETGVNTSTDAEYHDRGNQNRDDTSEESRALVEKIGANPDPLQVGTVQPMANNGIVWALPNGDVIIGNHRVNGVRLGYEKGTAGGLEKFVREDAAKRGIEIGEEVKKPLMVFVLERIESPDGKADEHEVVRLANESQNRGFNVREQAQNDAKILLDNNLLPQMAFRADGRIDETKSGDAIGKFRQESGAQGMVAEDGSLTEEGQTRIMNASLAALLGRGGNAALLQKIMSNAGRLDMQSELRALMKATPELMALAESKPGYDLREPLAEALTLFTEWRDKDEEMRLEKGKSRHDWRERAKDGHRLRGIPWQVHMSQGDMFRTPSPEALILGDMLAEAEELRSFDREDVESAAGKKRVIDLITNYLSDYAAAARAVNTETDDMFGTPPATRAEVLSAQRAKGGADGGARFSVSMRETLDPAAWGDLSRKVKVVGDGTSTWKYKEGWTTKLAKAELLDLAEKNLKLQENYTTDAKSGNHALRIGNVLYRITAKGLFHGADRRLKRIGAVIARIGDVLNASVEVPNVELPWHYRIASVNFETPEYVLLTSRSVGGAEDIVDVQSLYAVNAKADATAQTVTSTGIGLAGTSGAARELNHTNTSRLTEDILSNLRDAWQGAFFENLVRHNIDSILKDKNAPIARQHEAVVEKYRGTPQWMKAPNGQPTKLTEQQWIQVRTPSFKAWFGDWEEDAKNASKVVDENGEPLVVYRGAPFDPLAQKPGDGVIKPEAYFTADPEYAKRYTGNGGKVRAYYLNIRSPFDIRRPECLADLQKVYPDHNFERGRSGALDWAEASTVDGELLRDSFGDKYDGVIYDEGGDPGASGVSYRGISYVPIKGGKRVKSATDNNGDFSENPDVRFSVDQSRLKPATQEEFDRAIASWGEMKVDGSNAELAKWLFPDGRVLQPKLVPVMGGRAMAASHDSLFEFLDRPERTDPVERFEYGYADALAGGAIRLDLGNAGIEVARRPTDGQLDALYDILDAGYAVMEGEDYDNFAVDVDSETGGNAFTAVYRRGTSARKIVDDLREYFDSGSVPAAAGARYSVAPVYTGTAADYANRSRQGGVDDGPSLLKIGTGEGSQVYGWGLYGSTVRGVAERYAKDAREYNAEKNGKRIDLIFPENMLEAETAKRLMENGGDVRKTIEKLKLKGIGSAIIKELEEHGAEYSVAPKNEHLYEQTFFTDRAPGDESHLLKWYDAISDANWDRVIAQAEKEGLREKLKGAWWLHFNGDLEHFITDNGNSGDAIYERLSKLLGGPQSASEFLVRAGIDGVKYPVDSYGGKTVKDGDVAGWNYVSFRDDNIRVDHKWTDGQMRYSISVTPEMRRETTVNAAEATLEKTKAALAALAGKTLINDETKIEAQVNSEQARKIVSNKAVAKSEANGFTKAEHNSAAAIIETLWKYATLGKSAPDRDGDPNIRSVKRFVSPVFFRNGEGMKSAYAYITAKESVEHGHRIYSIEIEKLEALGGRLDRSQALLPNAPSEALARKLGAQSPAAQSASAPEGTPQSIPQTGAPAQGGEKRLSVAPPRRQMAYPQLRQMSDDELVSAAVAVRMALGASDKFSDKAVKVNTVQGIMRRLHPDWDTTTVGRESQRVISDAKKFGRQIRDDLDRGVSESRVLAHLPDKMREAFGTEMREEARRGQRLGTFGEKVSGEIEERQTRVIEDAVRVQTGLDASVVESTFGVDLSETLMHLADNPLKDGAPASGQSASADAAGDDAQGGEQKVVDVPAAVAKAVSEVVERSRRYADENAEKRKARKAEQGQGEAGDSTDGQAGLGHEDEGDPVAVATRKAGLDLENPRHLAEFVAELTRRYWIKDHGLAQTADVWRDLVAVQFLRKTAQSVYAKLCRELTYSRSRETAMQRIAKFDAAPTVAGLLSEMEFVGALINAQRIRDTKKGMCEKLDLFLREQFGAQGRFKPDREEGARKVSAEAELRARYMRHAMWLTPDAAALEASELQRTIDELSVDFKDAGRDRDQSREFVDAIRKLNVLREFGALRYRSLGEIESAARWWEDFARGSSDDIVREMSDREIRTKKAAHLLAVAFADPKRANVRESAGDWLNRFITGHMGFVSLLQDCMRGASAADAAAVKDIVDYIAREIQKAGDRSEAEKRRHNDAFHAAVESIYGRGFNAVMKEMMAPDERFAKYMGVVGGKRVTPTKGRALQLLVSLLQEGRRVEVEDEENPGKTKFVWEGGYHDNIVRHKREGQAQELMKLLTPQDMNMLKWLGAWYEQNRSGLSDVCRSLFGIGVYAELPNYFPVKMMLETQGLEKGQGVSWTIFPKALTPRVKNERDFDTSADIFSMWESRMEEAAQWKHHARLGLEMRGIFGRSELREAVRANHGASVDELMQGFITDILAGQGAVDRTTGGVQYFSDQIRGWTALCGLGGNVGVMMKQTTSIPAFGFEIGLVNTAKYMVSAFTPEGMEAMRRIWDSEQRRTRWQLGSSEAVRNALSQKNAGVLKRLLQASMITNKMGDSVPALVIGQGIYRDCMARGMSEEDAMAETWSLVERTQQSGRMENQTSVQRRNKLGRIMFQFLSTQQQYLQYEVRAIREVIARPDSVQRWGNLGRAILLNHFILSSAYFWMGELYKACLGQEPPEDELKDWVISCLLGPYGSLFVAGFCCKYTLERAIKGYSIKGGSSMLPMEAWLKTQVNDGAKLLEAIFDSDGDTWENMLEAAGRWMSDSNSTVRDLRKLWRYRVKGERQRR